MSRKYIHLALVYAVIAMAFGVFYREFTKYMEFPGETALSVLHTHYFMLGMFFFLILLLLEKSFGFSARKGTGRILLVYNIGLNLAGVGFLIRGLTQVCLPEVSSGMDAAISGIAGLGHILLGISLVLLLLRIRREE